MMKITLRRISVDDMLVIILSLTSFQVIINASQYTILDNGYSARMAMKANMWLHLIFTISLEISKAKQKYC